jgi:hypothetical protein
MPNSYYRTVNDSALDYGSSRDRGKPFFVDCRMRLEDMRRFYNSDISEAASPDTPMTHEQQLQCWAACTNQSNFNPCRLVPDRSELTGRQLVSLHAPLSPLLLLPLLSLSVASLCSNSLLPLLPSSFVTVVRCARHCLVLVGCGMSD